MSTVTSTVKKGLDTVFEYRIVVKNADGNILVEFPAVLGAVIAFRFRKKWMWSPLLFGINWISPYSVSIVKRTGWHPQPTERDRGIVTEIITIPQAERGMPERVVLQPLPTDLGNPPKGMLQPTDLQQIKGIGSKYEAILNQAGIRTVAELATFSAVALQNLLIDYGVTRKVDTQSWIDQGKTIK